MTATPLPLVLIVDDDPMTCLLAEETLRQAGFRTYTVGSCRSALKSMAQLRPSAVLLDLGSPDDETLAFCARLQQDSATPVIVMVESRRASEMAERAYSAGAVDVVTKPVAWDLLGLRVHHLLRIWAATAEQKRLVRQLECLIQLLNLSVADLTLEELLRQALVQIMELPGMVLKKGGGIFLADPGGQTLHLTVQVDLETPPGGHWSFGECQCGQADQGRKVHFFSPSGRHGRITSPGMPGWDYCHVPLESEDRLLGVMLLSCSPQQKWNDEQIALLATLGKFVTNLIERKYTDRRLTLTTSIFEDSLDAAMIVDEQLRIVEVNRMFTELTGFSAAEVQGRPLEILQPATEGQKRIPLVGGGGNCSDDRLGERRTWQGEVWLRRKTSERLLSWMQVVRNPASGDGCFYLVTFADISERKREAECIRRLAFYDQLTGLCNRSLLMDRLTLECRRAARSGSSLAVLFFDLDRFKAINDALGHDQGDALLCEVARRIQGVVREEDTVSRLGGDEFVIVLTGFSVSPIVARQQAARIAEKVITVLERPYRLAGREITTSASLGIAIGLSDAHEPVELLKLADLAMYTAKKEGGACYRFYQPRMTQLQVQHQDLQRRFRQALEQETLTVYLQPRLRVTDQAVTGVEVLVRWWDEASSRWISPKEFIPLAEETGLIDPLYEWLLEQVCRHLRDWHQAELGRRLPRMGVNVAIRQFQQRRFAERTLELLEKWPRESDCCLELELTEAALMQYPQESLRTLTVLKEAGVRFAIDDFGTGYFNLQQLQQFPVDLLKIDCSFVQTCLDNEDSATVVRAIIAMARELRLEVVAEGVETSEQLAFLRQLGCDHYQGYLCAPALAPEEFEAFLRNLS